MRKAILGVLLVALSIVPIGIAQSTDEQGIDRLFQDLKLALINRSAPEALLSPSMAPSRRQEEAQKALRPYVTLQFRYNLADLHQTNAMQAKLPLIMEWETARQTGTITGSAELEKINDRWYFRNFDFMAFPWAITVIGCSFGIAFAVVVLYLYRRSIRHRRQLLPA
jgi:hypothetical protein